MGTWHFLKLNSGLLYIIITKTKEIVVFVCILFTGILEGIPATYQQFVFTFSVFVGVWLHK
jgi:hypothetical protein